MKVSRYNLLVPHTEEPGTYILFNGFTKALLLLNKREKEQVEGVFAEPNQAERYQEIWNELVQNQFLIDDGRDELAEIGHRYQEMMSTETSLLLTIVPTLQCNFNCIYCYQHHSRRIYREEKLEEQFSLVKDRIFRLVDRRLKNGLQKLKVSWYGGEPTVAMQDVLEMTQTLGEMCKQSGAEFIVDICSNGYLLNEVAIRGMMPYLKTVTVTVDGPAEIHDSRRRYDGESTYRTILDNLARIRIVNPTIEINLRVTIDRNNLSSIPELLDDLQQYGMHGINLRFRSLYADPEKAPEFFKLIFSDEECARIIPNLTREAIKRELITNISPSPLSFVRCDAPMSNSFVVMPNGMLHKCWGEVGTKDCVIGELGEDGEVIFNENIIEWLRYNPLDCAECVECNLLPMCMGECCYNDVVSKLKTDYLTRSNGGCSLIKYNLEEFISIFTKVMEQTILGT